jgi:AcrR family transcriptional regulator
MKTRRQAILEAATWLFAVKGYREASTTEVARLTNTAEGTLFYHFESKEKLFLAVLEESRKRIGDAVSEFTLGLPEASGIDRLERTVAFYVELAAENEVQFMLLHRHYAYELAQVNDRCRSLLEAVYEEMISAFEEAVRKGRDDGSIGDVPVRKTALLVFMLVDGLVRLKHDNMYEAGSLFDECIEGCRRLAMATGKVR